MNQIPAIVERALDGTCSVHCKNEIFSGMGATVEDAKADMLRQMRFYVDTAKDAGFKYPEFLDNDFEVTCTVDAVSLMKFYLHKGWFTLATLEKVSGISQKQLWAYTHGTKPRKAQEERILAGLQMISSDLDTVFSGQ